MGRGALVLYLQTPESAETAGDAAMPFGEDLAEKLQWAVDLSEEEREAWGERAMRRVERHYSWSAVTEAYEALLRRLTSA